MLGGKFYTIPNSLGSGAIVWYSGVWQLDLRSYTQNHSSNIQLTGHCMTRLFGHEMSSAHEFSYPLATGNNSQWSRDRIDLFDEYNDKTTVRWLADWLIDWLIDCTESLICSLNKWEARAKHMFTAHQRSERRIRGLRIISSHSIYIHTNTYIYIYIYICMYACQLANEQIADIGHVMCCKCHYGYTAVKVAVMVTWCYMITDNAD